MWPGAPITTPLKEYPRLQLPTPPRRSSHSMNVSFHIEREGCIGTGRICFRIIAETKFKARELLFFEDAHASVCSTIKDCIAAFNILFSSRPSALVSVQAGVIHWWKLVEVSIQLDTATFGATGATVLVGNGGGTYCAGL